MDTSNIAFIAGSISSSIFAVSLVPMLRKAYRTKDMASYSLINIALTNVGNLIHSIYVYSLPAGPIWVLHTFYLVAMALMLVWYLRYAVDVRRLMSELRNTRHLLHHMDAAATSISWIVRFNSTGDINTYVGQVCPA